MFFVNIFLLFVFAKDLLAFYDNILTAPLSHNEQTISGTTKIFYANIHQNNVNYSGMQDFIQENDPDVLMFVEFSDHHYENMKGFLEKRYPYHDRAAWSKRLMVGSVIFSKQKVDNLSDEFQQSARRYGYFKIELHDKPYYFYLVHTSSPISPSFWDMRNKQISTLKDDFYTHKDFRHSGDNVMLIGDFNISPRSSYYNLLKNAFGQEFLNYSSKFGIRFTWNYLFFWSHIDHVFANFNIIDLKSVVVKGSDHIGYIIEM